MTTWLLFTYKVPNEPSARRVYVWRKLKHLGAILLQDTLWTLPDLAHTREKLQWLTAEVNEMVGGEAILWAADPVFTGQVMTLEQQFREQVDTLYREIMSDLAQPDPDLAALAKRYQQAQRQDYLHSALGEQVRQVLLDRRGAEKL